MSAEDRQKSEDPMSRTSAPLSDTGGMVPRYATFSVDPNRVRHTSGAISAQYSPDRMLIHNLRLVSGPAGPPDERGVFYVSPRYDRFGSNFPVPSRRSKCPVSPTADVRRSMKIRLG